MRNNKKLAFTLAEIVIALFIVGVLTVLTLPIINRQLNKTDEFAYYMAFRTVEKMGAQIVMTGDPLEDETSSIKEDVKIAKESVVNKIKVFLANASQKFAYAEEKFFQKLFPKVFAVTIERTSTTTPFSSEDYDNIWLAYKVCKSTDNTVLKAITSVTNADGTTTEKKVFYSQENDFDSCKGITKNGEGDDEKNVKANDILDSLMPYEIFLDKTASEIKEDMVEWITNSISSTTPNARAFATKLMEHIVSSYTDDTKGGEVSVTKEFVVDNDEGGNSSGDDDGKSDDEDEEPVEGQVDYSSDVSGRLVITEKYSVDVSTSSSGNAGVARPAFSNADCDESKGYVGMVNAGAPETINCEPASGYEISENNPRVACPITGNNTLSYAYTTSSGALACRTCTASSTSSIFFNETTGECCPANSVSSGGECACNPGWDWNDAKTECVRVQCPKGYSLKDSICVLNPPIIKAQRLCELIASNWNISKQYCDSTMFSAIPNFSGTTYYKDVYNAAKGNTTTLMSIDSKEGAFMYNPKDETGLKPNIIFGNGQFLWILSDKTASIPGLTYTTVDNTPSRNVCKNLNKITESACTTAGGYYCASEHGCYTMEASSLNEETKGLGDSRNCCAAPDLSDIAEEIKINPNYTTSDYYKDVRYYAISGFTVFVDINGTRGTGTLWEDVFPFYVSSNGSVYPAYPLDTMKYSDEDGKINKSQLLGGNSSKLLPVDVYYFSTVSGKRTKKVAFSGISYARAMCSMKKVSYYAPYCRNLESKFYAGKYNNEPVSSNSYLVPGSKNNPCNTETCFMSLRRRFMSF